MEKMKKKKKVKRNLQVKKKKVKSPQMVMKKWKNTLVMMNQME